jgi:hypothetical protein
MYMLARQYVKLRSDLLVTVSPEWSSTDGRRVYALRGQEYLELAKKELLDRRPRVYVCSGLLYLAEINLAWLYPPGMLWLRCQQALNRLERLQTCDDVTWLISGLQDARYKEDKRWLRATLADASEYFSQQDARLLMDDDLQVTRLRSLLWYVGAALILLVLAVPYITTTLGQSIPGWPVVKLDQVWLTQVVSALAVSAVGAVGGIFSGLISTRDSSTTLDEYRSSMLKLALKPLVGAVASMTLYLLLSWQILTGVKVTNGGTFLLVGFLAGFSERYFLKLLRVSPEDNGEQELRRRNQLISGIAVPSVPSSSDERQARFDGEPFGSSTGPVTGPIGPGTGPGSGTDPGSGTGPIAATGTLGPGESSMPYSTGSTAPTETPGPGESSMPYSTPSPDPSEGDTQVREQ